MNLTKSQIIKLLHVKGIGRSKVVKLNDVLTFRPTLDIDLVEAILDYSQTLKLQPLTKQEIFASFEKAENLIEESERQNIKALSYGDTSYPKQLLNTPNFPVILYFKGNIHNLSENPCVAVIGTREPSPYGKAVGERIGYRLGEEKITVVSGLAKGCDTAAHTGCLKANGLTHAILAHGLDSVYPRENAWLAEKILEHGGCLISEYIVKTRAIGNFFVERDRIQAAFSKATVVIETDIKGGTMHTVQYTIDYGRILAAVAHPHDKKNDKSRGNEKLISEEKARALNTKEDIDWLISKVSPSRHPNLATIEKTPLTDINLILFDDKEWSSITTTEQPKSEKKKKSKKSQQDNVQLALDGSVPSPRKAKTKKKDNDSSHAHNESNI
ncbi:DNA-processing protein DprA [Paraflavitalea pollutisoli]|uniref:DNA-processing protein DprA n=1 Tax=Paraflavitalea pollutisoli TaxID=3034143 RepID=UPI0023ECC519|nr:DNA-processing protein DprA [Paraflavitalea sp. H1-2-19X]